MKRIIVGLLLGIGLMCWGATYVPTPWIQWQGKGFYPMCTTNVTLQEESRIDIRVQLCDTVTQVIFAQGDTAGFGKGTEVQLLVVNNKWRVTCGNETIFSTSTVQVGITNNISLVMHEGKWQFEVNGNIEIASRAINGYVKSPYGLTLGHRHLSGWWGQSPSTMRFFGAEVYGQDGELQAKFVPAMYNAYTPTLRDEISGNEYNSNAWGYDGDAHAKAMFEMFGVLGKAEGGHEVESINNLNNSDVHLHTDVVIAGDDRVETCFTLGQSARHHVIWSAGGAGQTEETQWMTHYGSAELLIISGEKFRIGNYRKTGTAAGICSQNVKHIVSCSVAEGVIMDGEKMETQYPSDVTDYRSNSGISFFARFQETDKLDLLSCPALMTLYYAKVYKADGSLRADFVPWVDSEGQAGLRDKLTGKVYLPYRGRLTPSTEEKPLACYVSPVGASDANAGHIKSPMGSIAGALGRVASTGTVYLLDGTYVMNDQVQINLPIKIEGYNRDPGRVVITNAGEVLHRFLVMWGSDNALRYVTVTGGGTPGYGSSVYMENASIEDCVFENTCNYVSNNWVIIGGTVFTCGGRVARCVFRNNSANGDCCLGSALLLQGTTIAENCVFEGNVCDGPIERACTVYMTGSSKLINCTFVSNRVALATAKGTAGVRMDSTSCKVINCAFLGNTHAAGNSLAYTITYVNNLAGFDHCMAEEKINSLCKRFGDPLFRDPANGDYTPLRDSPLVNQGLNYLGDEAEVADYGLDLGGNMRYVGAGIDVGAYEHQGRDPAPKGTQIFMR